MDVEIVKDVARNRHEWREYQGPKKHLIWLNSVIRHGQASSHIRNRTAAWTCPNDCIFWCIRALAAAVTPMRQPASEAR